MQYLIGVDLGTQGTKAALQDETGKLVKESFEPSRLIYPEPGAVEQDPRDMLESVLRCIRDVVVNSGIAPGDVAAVGIDGQMAGVMGVDADGMAATPYDSWLDTRCGSQRGQFLAYGEEAVIELTGTPVTYAHGPKILWWKNERPDIYRNIRRFVQPAAYCVMRMCGLSGSDAFIDHTYLHFTGFADTANRKWSAELLSELGVDAEKMPRIVKPYDKMGGLTPEMAGACGLLAGTPMVAGCGDTAASSFGAGIIREGLLFDVAGTASVLACAAADFRPDVKHKTILYAPSVIDGLYTPMAYIGGGGLCLKWFRDSVLQKSHNYSQLDEIAAKIMPGSEDLLFVPHFSGRTCPNDVKVRGSFINISWQHGPAHFYRAIMEGIAYEYGIYKDIIKELNPELDYEQLISVGGGAKSRLFGQIKADALGIPVSTIRLSDTAASGCCAIAGYGVGLYDSLTASVERRALLNETVEPRPDNTALYGRLQKIYAELFPALNGVYSNLQQLLPGRKGLFASQLEIHGEVRKDFP